MKSFIAIILGSPIALQSSRDMTAAASSGSNYSLNLTLVSGQGEEPSYWLLTPEDLPPGFPLIPSASLLFSPQSTNIQTRADPECSPSHRASTPDCFNLLAAFSNDLTDLPASCHIWYNNCYVSWSAVVPDGAVRAHLYNAGVETYNRCNENGWVSGLKRGVDINGKRITECLSDRATGCS